MSFPPTPWDADANAILAVAIPGEVPPIPTLSEWGMIILVGLMGLVMGRRLLMYGPVPVTTSS